MIRRATIVTMLVLLAGVPTVSAQQGQQQQGQRQGQQQQPTRTINASGPQNVRLTFLLIQADGFTDEDPEIRPVVTELRKLFRFKGYRLASKSILQSLTNGSVKQRITDPDGQIYTISASIGAERGQDTPVFLSVTLTALGDVPANTSSLIDASVSLMNGKTVVLGSAQRNSESKALILVVTPTINP